MYIETVLFPLHITQSHDALMSVVELCRTQNKHLSVLLFDESPPPPVMGLGETGTTEIWAKLIIEYDQALQNERSVIEAILDKNKVLFDVEAVLSDGRQVDDFVASRAPYTDIIVVERPYRDNTLTSFARHLYHGALFAGGKPLMVFNKALASSFEFEKVLIAWDGKQSASRAVVESLSILKNAQSVHVLIVDPPKKTNSNDNTVGWELSTYLARHKVKVAIDVLESSNKNVSSVIRDQASKIGADLLVCGSFGRSPLRERIFGGTTGELLDDCSIPVFLMH